MHFHDSRPSDPTATRPVAIEAAAAIWLGLRDRGMSAAETADFIRWLEQDARHTEVFAELDETWKYFNQLQALRPTGAAGPDADLLAPRRRVRDRRPWIYATLSAVAAVVVMTLLLAAPASSAGRQSIATAVGAYRKVDLPDGSVVQVNTDSAIEINFTAHERRVRLVRGEVLFQVAKNPARPFIVSAGRVDVRAVGTAFNVRLRAERVEVLVTEGRVRVNDSNKGDSLLQPSLDGEPPVLSAGERATIPMRAGAGRATAIVTPAPPLEVERTLAWQERRLEFDSVLLQDVVEEFNRYNPHQLIIADPALGRQRFGGTFRADGYETFVRLLETTFGVSAERSGQNTILRLKPAPQGAKKYP